MVLMGLVSVYTKQWTCLTHDNHHRSINATLTNQTGRLPIRVELKGLTEEDMYRILTEPVTNLIAQQVRP